MRFRSLSALTGARIGGPVRPGPAGLVEMPGNKLPVLARGGSLRRKDKHSSSFLPSRRPHPHEGGIMPDANGEPDLGRLLRQAQLELEQALRDGRDGRAEEIFARYPALAADQDSALDIIYSTEFTLREMRGEKPTP